MLNLGLAAFRLDAPDPETPIATFEANLEPLPEAGQHPDTMRFWSENPEAWAYVRGQVEGAPTPVSAEVAMAAVGEWLLGLPGKPVMVVYPTYDFLFVRWYLVRFGPPAAAIRLGFQALDVKTLAMAVMNHPSFKGVSKRTLSKWDRGLFRGQPPHDHTGLADAIGQGMLFVRLMAHLRSGD